MEAVPVAAEVTVFEILRNLLANLILDWLFPRGWMGCETWGNPAPVHW